MSVLRPLGGALLVATALGAAWPASINPTPEWRAREELRIGGGPGIGKLPRVSRVAVGRDGAVHVLTRTDELMAFDPRGGQFARQHVISGDRRNAITKDEVLAGMRRTREESEHLPRGAGRYESGSGPGFTAVTSDSSRGLGWIGDSLWAAVRGTDTIALFRPDGRRVGEIAYSPSLDGSPASFPLGMLADGSLLRTISSRDPGTRAPERSMPPPPEAFRMPVIPGPPSREDDEADHGFLVRASTDGRVLQGLEIFAERRLPVVLRNPYGSAVKLGIPFQDHPLIAVTPDGAEVIFVERYRPSRQGSASYSVARYDVLTRRRTAHHYPYTPRPVSRTSIDSLLALIVDSPGAPVSDHFVHGFPSVRAAKAVVEAALEIPPYHPPVIDLVAGADRTVWLREHATAPWRVIGRDGALLGTVALPPGVRLVHADAEVAWGVVDPPRGSDASAVLIRYRLLKP